MSDQHSAIVTVASISGMTCSHCVAAVTEELEALDGVQTVSVELDSGGISHATIRSTGDLSAERISKAIAEAGYNVVDEKA